MRRNSTPLRRVRRWWDKHFVYLDPALASVLGLGIDARLLAFHVHRVDPFLAYRLTSFVTTGTGVSGVLLGLTLTSTAIVAERLRPRSKRTANTQTDTADSSGSVAIPTAQAERLVKALIRSTNYLGVATVLGLGGLLLTGDTALKAFLALWIVALSVSVGSFARSISLLRATLLHVVRGPAQPT